MPRYTLLILILIFIVAAAAACGPAAPEPWHVTDHGGGPVRVGMTMPDAGSAAGALLTAPGDECGYVTPAGTPEGVRFMVTEGTIARVDVTAGTTPTAEGARIGQPEDDVAALYEGRVTVSPHKYTDGHYLTVVPKAGQNPALRIVFETDGKTVTRYRAGRLPEVEWVEGCG